jgi:hypothetical protein
MEKSTNEEIDISWLEEMKIPDPPVIFYKESMKTVDIYFIYVTDFGTIIRGGVELQINSKTMISTAVKGHIW